MSKRREQARDVAVEVCRALRQYVAAPVSEGRTLDDVMPYLLKWMSLQDKTKFDPPKPIRKSR